MEILRHSRLRIASLLTLVLAAGSAGSAQASIVRVRWQPITPAAGYHVYLRAAGTPYGAPLDVGLPLTAADGTVAAYVPSVAGAPAFHVAVAAYASDGTESPLSGELAVGDLDPCAIDRCAAVGSCQFGAEHDGSWCMHADETDPCLALGSCVSGACTRSERAAGLYATRVHLGVRRREGALAVHGLFSADPALDPRATGATIEIADESGAILYFASVPGSGFTTYDFGRGFRYTTSRSAALGSNGLRILNLHRSNRAFRVTARAESADLRVALGEPALHATVRFGGSCARDLGLTCRTIVGGGISCR
ncbi:MAG TPA: hypothetical protein VGK30_09135 [Candidatus Binatia bacterium]|jgi:hypothetical protein